MAGLVVLAFELTAARVVAPYLGATIYTWTSIIGVILAALAAGYAWGGVLADARKRHSDVVLLLMAAALLISVVNLFKDSLLAWLVQIDWPLQLQSFGASLLLFAPATFLLGAVAPYLARLCITDVATSGRRLSRIEAAGTLGSLAGTFLTGYVLFGLVGTSHILILLALALLLASFLMDLKKYLYVRLALIVLAVSFGLLASKPLLSGFIKEIDTAYSRVIIRDLNHGGEQVRVLQTDNYGLQSGIYIDGRPELAFAYIRAFAHTAELKPTAQRQLVVGGGAFTFPEYLARHFPSSQVDAVEIDPRLIGISRDYFNFRRPDNLNVISADGRHFLNTVGAKYDAVYLDAFNSLVPPFQLLTKEAVERIQARLRSDGMVAANIISAAKGPRSGLIQHVYSTFKTTFPDVRVYQVESANPATPQNLLLLAGKSIDDVALDTIAGHRSEFAALLQNKLDLRYNSGLVMTDGYAPVERLAL